MRRVWAGLGILALAAGCGERAGLAGMERGERGRVVRVYDGDALVLETGQSVRLVGLEAPSFGRGDDPDEPHAERARRALEDLALGHVVELYYAGLTRDRYGRALAHAVTRDRPGGDLWLNEVMLRDGQARLRIYPDTSTGGEDLADAETAARAAGRGLWAEAAYRPLMAEALAPEARGFELVELGLGDVVAGAGEAIACRRAVQGTALTLRVEAAAAAVCEWPAGGRYLMRGWVSGGELELTHPLNAERMGEPEQG